MVDAQHPIPKESRDKSYSAHDMVLNPMLNTSKNSSMDFGQKKIKSALSSKGKRPQPPVHCDEGEGDMFEERRDRRGTQIVRDGRKAHHIVFRDQMLEEEADEESEKKGMDDYSKIRSNLPESRQQRRRQLQDVHIVESYKEFNQVEPYNAQCCNIL
jgi:hypothetical protein